VTGPAMFANGVPQLAALLAACAEGRAREIRDEVERHLAHNPEDPHAGFLLRLITAAAPDYGTALKAIEAECSLRQAQALASLTRGLESAKAEGERARAETENARAETKNTRVEAERARAEAQRARAEAERARVEAGNARAEAGSAQAEAQHARAEAEHARVEAGNARAVEERAQAETQSWRIEAERARAESERTRAAGEEETTRLAAKQEQQAALIDKLAYVNEELERQQRELLASRWRRLGRRLGLAKRASFEA